MRQTTLPVTATLLLLLPLAAAGAAGPRPRPQPGGDGARSFPVVETADREQRWQLPAGGGKVVVDGISGSIRARAVDGDTVTLRVRETVRARDAAGVALARREMPLLLHQSGDVVTAFVDSPFRRQDGSLDGSWSDLSYRVVHDFELTVPRRAEVVLRTVNEGEVELVGTEGPFDVRNVNGPVALTDVAGAGSARTVNGDLAVRFRNNPPGPCTLETVNGDVTAVLLPGLAADIRYSTLNGEAWSDFPFTVAPRAPVAAGDRRDGRLVIRGRWQEGIRIGGGGPLLSLKTVNGHIYLKNRHATGDS
jgi:hypothetical protein